MINNFYNFNTFNNFCSDGIGCAIEKINTKCEKPIIICVGSDLVLGDSLGPLVGTLLKKKNLPAYVYGNLNYPITAKEVSYAKTYLKKMHPNSYSIAIDAAIGDKTEIGQIKVFDKGIKPGLGVDKDLEELGDGSIIGIVAEKSQNNFSLYNLTRLNLIFRMAETISDGIEKYIKTYNRKSSLNLYGA